MRAGQAQKGEGAPWMHTPGSIVDNRPDDTCGEEAAGRPTIKVTARENEAQVEIVGRQKAVLR